MSGVDTPAERAVRWAGWALTAAALGGLAALAGTGLDLEARARLVRYVGVLASVAVGIGAPHLLLADSRARRLQLANPAAAALQLRQIGRWMPVVLAVAAPGVVLGVQGGRPALAAEALAAALALGSYAQSRFAGLGLAAQSWEAGTSGSGYRRLRELDPRARFMVPDALVPGLLWTGEVFLAGSAIAIAGQAGGTGWALAAAGAVGLAAAARAARQAPVFDRVFWTSLGVWADAFQGSADAEAREPVAFDAVYWAPRRVRPEVWAGLVSLDRRFPFGRAVAAVLAVLVAVHLAGAPVGVRSAAFGLYLALVAGVGLLTASDALVPASLAVRLGGPMHWTAARFLMMVRWLPPLLAAGLLLVWLTGLRWTTLLAWAGLTVVVSLASAASATAAALLRFRRASA